MKLKSITPKSKTVLPISPKEARQSKESSLPDFVLQAFNELISENLSGGAATVTQEEAVVRIQQKAKEVRRKVSREDIFKNDWLDIEGVFERAGWSVEFDKPAYNETYDGFFTFREAENR